MQNREEFVVPEVIPWSKVSDALGYTISCLTLGVVSLIRTLHDYLRKLLCVGGCGLCDGVHVSLCVSGMEEDIKQMSVTRQQMC